MKYLNEFRKAFSGEASPVFRISEAKTFLKLRGAHRAYVYTMIHNLIVNKEIIRITRGVYTFHTEEATVAGFAFSPFYYGLENALTIHRLWDQMTNPVILTTRKVRIGVRQFAGRNYVVRRVNEEFLFGYEIINYSGVWVPVSDVEKTLLDMIYFHHNLDEETLNLVLKKIDIKKFLEYLGRVEHHMNRGMMNHWIIKEIKIESKDKAREKFVKNPRSRIIGIPRRTFPH